MRMTEYLVIEIIFSSNEWPAHLALKRFNKYQYTSTKLPILVYVMGKTDSLIIQTNVNIE